MNWKKIWYSARIAFRPHYWLRITDTSKEWDDELWDLLEQNPIYLFDSFHAVVGDKTIWIANFPYGAGTTSAGGVKIGPRRRTVLLLAESLKKAPMLRVINSPYDFWGTFKKYNVQLPRKLCKDKT